MGSGMPFVLVIEVLQGVCCLVAGYGNLSKVGRNFD